MATKRLIGRDGEVYTVTKEPVTSGDGTTTLTDAYYVATAIAEESGLPDGLKTGYIFKGTPSMTLKEGDKVIKLNISKRCDIRNISIEYNADEIDITTLCDDEKNYRPGFVDASGSMDGITTIDVSEDIMNKFMPVLTQNMTLSGVNIKEINGDSLLIKFELNSPKAGGDVMSYFAPIAITSYTIGAQIDSEQTFTSNFRITKDEDIKPVILKEVAA